MYFSVHSNHILDWYVMNGFLTIDKQDFLIDKEEVSKLYNFFIYYPFIITEMINKFGWSTYTLYVKILEYLYMQIPMEMA